MKNEEHGKEGSTEKQRLLKQKKVSSVGGSLCRDTVQGKLSKGFCALGYEEVCTGFYKHVI